MCDHIPTSGRRYLDGVEYLRIGRTPAQITREIMSYLFVCRVGLAIQQLLHHENESGRAKSTLKCACVYKGLLNGIESLLRRREALNGFDSRSIGEPGEIKTAGDCPRIHQNRAAAA